MINNIRVGSLPPEQKVVGSNPTGRTNPPIVRTGHIGNRLFLTHR